MTFEKYLARLSTEDLTDLLDVLAPGAAPPLVREAEEIILNLDGAYHEGKTRKQMYVSAGVTREYITKINSAMRLCLHLAWKETPANGRPSLAELDAFLNNGTEPKKRLRHDIIIGACRTIRSGYPPAFPTTKQEDATL